LTGLGIPDGYVDFYNGSSYLTSVEVIGGIASYTPGIGSYEISVQYFPNDGNYLQSAKSPAIPYSVNIAGFTLQCNITVGTQAALCIEYSGCPRSGSQLFLLPCIFGSSNQSFYAQLDGHTGEGQASGTLRLTIDPTLCISAACTSFDDCVDATDLYLEKCDPSQVNQLWVWPGDFTIRPYVNTAKVIDAFGGAFLGTHMIIYHFHDGQNQLWNPTATV